MITTKFKMLEIILMNKKLTLNKLTVELMKSFPDWSWAEIVSYLYLLKQEGYINLLVGDDSITALSLQPTAFAKLNEAKEQAETEKEKQFFGALANLLIRQI